MMKVGVSKFGYTGLIFVGRGVQIDGAYYCDLILSQLLLSCLGQVHLSTGQAYGRLDLILLPHAQCLLMAIVDFER